MQKESHKNIGLRTQQSEAIDFAKGFAQKNSLTFDILTNFVQQHYDPKEGHILYEKTNQSDTNTVISPSGELFTPVAWVKETRWRSENEKGETAILPEKRDIIKFRRTKAQQPFNPFATDLGLELEPTIYDPHTGNMVDMTTETSGMLTKQLEPINAEHSPELLKGTWEINSGHSKNLQERKNKLNHALQAIVSAADHQGGMVVPLATLPHTPVWEDITNNPYIRRMVEKFETFDRAKFFDVMAAQFHFEIDGDWNTALQVINMATLVSPILYPASLAGNYALDHIHPNPKKIYEDNPKLQAMSPLDKTTLQTLDQSEWLSTRQWLRQFGSSSSGVLQEPLPDFQTFLQKGEQEIRTGEKATLARVQVGNHGDFRPRFDLGTIEVCFFDTFGGNAEKLSAFQEFTGALLGKLWYFVKQNKVDELAQAYPSLFCKEITKQTLQQTKQNMFEVSKSGFDSKITAVDGTRQQAGDLFIDVVKFVQTPLHDDKDNIHFDGLSNETLNEIIKTAITPQQKDFARHLDENGLASTALFYEEGIGTLAHCIQERTKTLKQKGLRDKEIIEDVKLDVAKNFKKHVETLV